MISKQICKLDARDTLKNISRSSTIKKKYWDCKYDQVLVDIDTTDDYNNLKLADGTPLTEQITKRLKQTYNGI